MKSVYELSEAEIKQAIAHFCDRQGSADFSADGVSLHVEQARDFADRPAGYYTVTATARAIDA